MAKTKERGQASTTLYLQLLAVSLGLMAFNVIYHEKVVHQHVEQHSAAHAKHLEQTTQFIPNDTKYSDILQKQKDNVKDLIRSTDVLNEVKKVGEKTKSTHLIDSVGGQKDHLNADTSNNLNKVIKHNPFDEVSHEIAGLSCAAYGGPSDEIATKEMVYWEDIPSDSNYISPFYDPATERYLTFEPDGGGWNNIRMAMETVIVMAHAMGRTLVLPPEKRMYLIGKGDRKQRFKFTFNDFFHLDSIHSEHDGFNMITMEEFLNREAMTGKMVNITTGQISFPPDNRTNWDGEDLKPLWEYLRETTDVRNWKPDRCLAVFPSQPGADDISRFSSKFKQALDDHTPHHSPVPTDGDLVSRLKESVNRRNELCLYDEKMQTSRVVHFMCYHKERARLLTHFYLFLFFEDWKQDLWSKRFVRDHIRYRDEIMCAAARVVDAVRDRAKRNKLASPNHDGLYNSMHIRRGDFQFKQTRVNIEIIYEQIKNTLRPGGTLYIATDERDKKFFDLLKEHYDVCFLDDFKHMIEGVNTNYYGMLDQLVATKGEIFFGTYFSTLSGYIMRMRGYFSTKLKLEGYENGDLINSYYLFPTSYRLAMNKYRKPVGNNWEREFPISWRDIDKGVEDLRN